MAVGELATHDEWHRAAVHRLDGRRTLALSHVDDGFASLVEPAKLRQRLIHDDRVDLPANHHGRVCRLRTAYRDVGHVARLKASLDQHGIEELLTVPRAPTPTFNPLKSFMIAG